MATQSSEMATESQPLLPENVSEMDTKKKTRGKLMILVVGAIFILGADCGFYLSAAPQTAIFEKIICRNYLEFLDNTNTTLPASDVADPCKSEVVQGELALITGYKDGFSMVPPILLSLPYGVLADHWGRKPVVYLGMLGIVLDELWARLICLWSDVLPLRMVWLSALWKIIGGGDQVVTSVVCTMIADVVSEDERSTALFTLMSWVYVADIVATPTSAYLMTFDPWIPWTLGFFIIILGCIPFIFLPETLGDAKAKKANRHGTDNTTQFTEPTGKMSTMQLILYRLREFKASAQFIWKDINIIWMIIAAFVSVMCRQSSNMLLQYASKRFGWSIAKASLLVTIRGSVGLTTCLLLMPGLNWLSGKYLNLHGKYRDHWLSKITGIFSVVGFLIVGLAPTTGLLIFGLVVVAMGAAFGVNTRSLATALVVPDHVGTLYSTFAISQSMGVCVAGPLFAYLFKWGMHLGNAWLGLPFLQAGLFFVLATVAVWRIRVDQSLPGDDGEQEEEEPLIAESA
ncbi:hypothetical protein N7528_008457 [Penicillium herquei]|nr:hypothetical protein N7528_008457 [Penicillium herquei]